MRVVSATAEGGVESVSCCAGDGNIVLWDINDLANQLKDLQL